MYKDPDKQKAFMKAYQREWLAKRRLAFFDGKSCVKCGSTDRLELDHIDPAQKSCHQIWSWSEVRRKAEIAKCQILCYNCHKVKSSSEHPNGEAHWKSKLTDKQVLDIRRRFKDGEVPNEIAKLYGVTGPTIRDIVYLRTWKHI